MRAEEADAFQQSSDGLGTQEVAVLSVDIVGHTELLRKKGLVARRAIETYQNLVDISLTQYDTQSTGWAGDGGFGTFLGPRRCEQAVLAGIHILHQVELLNLDQSACDLGEPLRMRVAAVAGSIQYREPMSKMVELVICEADKLQKKTRAQEFAIGDTIHRLLPETMQEVFELVDRNFNGQQVYVYRGVSRARQPENSEVGVLLGHVEAGVRSVRGLCDDRSLCTTVDAGFLSRLHGEVKQCYENIATFRRRCSGIDPNWAATYLRHLLDTTLKLQRLENALWLCLMDWRQGVRFTSEAKYAHDLGFSSIAQDHGHEEMALGELKAWLSQALGEGLDREADAPSAGLSSHLERLVRVDEMERMAEFVALGRYDRNLVCEYVRAHRDQELGRSIVHTLWSIGDLVVGEELKGSLGQVPRADGLFGVLLTDREYYPRFQVVEHFLGDHLPDPDSISRRFTRLGIDPTQRDLNVVWRAVVIAHPKPQIRYAAAERAPLNALWPAVAYHGISLWSLAVIATRLNQKESVDLKKIFFDCAKSRLERRIQDGDAAELRLAADMVEGFYESDLFVETPYFRALEALLALFESRVSRFGGQIQSLEAKLGEKIRHVRATPKKEGSIPDGVGDLPPAVQRHLAGEGCYVEEFAFHEDERIAVEVERFLVGDALVRVAKAIVGADSARGGRSLNPKLLERMSGSKRAKLHEEVERFAAAEGKGTLGSHALRREVERKLGRDYLRDLEKTQRRM